MDDRYGALAHAAVVHDRPLRTAVADCRAVVKFTGGNRVAGLFSSQSLRLEFARRSLPLLCDNFERADRHEAEDRCFDKVIAYNDLYTLKRVEIPFEGSTIAGILHLPKDVKKPPCVIYRARHGHDERGLPQRPEQCVRPAWHGLPLDRRAGTGREQSSWHPGAAGHLEKALAAVLNFLETHRRHST